MVMMIFLIISASHTVVSLPNEPGYFLFVGVLTLKFETRLFFHASYDCRALSWTVSFYRDVVRGQRRFVEIV